MENCYGQEERIPRELLHTQDERLTSKHIQTLSFLQDLAKENKVLKQKVQEFEEDHKQCKELHELARTSQNRIKDIQEQYLKRADEINQMLADQHRAEMMEVIDEKMEMERTLKEEILKLRHEIGSLQRTNLQLREDPDKSDEMEKEREKYTKRIADLEHILERLQTEVKELTVQNKKLHSSLEQSQAQSSELHHLQNMQDINKQLSEELREANQKNIELIYNVERLEKKLRDDQLEKDQSQLVEALKNKLEKVLKEKELAVVKESDMRTQCKKANEIISSQDEQLEFLIAEREKLQQEYRHLCMEYDKLYRRLQQDEDRANFKEFVAVKRELAAVKNENELLKLKNRTVGSLILPLLKEEPPALTEIKSKMKKGKKKTLAIMPSHELDSFVGT